MIESSQCILVQWYIQVDSKDSDQTGSMPMLVWIFAGSTCHFVGYKAGFVNLNNMHYHRVINRHQTTINENTCSDILRKLKYEYLMDFNP